MRQACHGATTTPGERRPEAGRRTAVCALVAVLLAGVSLVAGGGRPAAAHAFVERSDPPANAVLTAAPPRVSLWFTEPLEQSYSRADLYDQHGKAVAGTTVTFDATNRNAMVLGLPPNLAHGTYSVVWRSLSAADGHQAQSYFSFTVGTEADVRTVIPPATVGTSGPPDWLKTLARWVPFLGLAPTVAVWPVWLLVLRPAISPVWQVGPALTRRVRRLAAVGVLVAVLGSVFALLVQGAGADDGRGLLSATRDTLTDTRYGRLWLMRVSLTLVDAAALMVGAWWWPRRRRWLTAGTLLLAVVLPLPFSLVSHASAQTTGRAAAIAFDVLHLLGASIWVGGLILLAGALLPTLRDLTPAGRHVVLGRAIPRFSAMALTSWGVIGLTGLYSAWLQVGNWKGLTETSYGHSLAVKLLLLVPLLLLAAFNLLVVSRHVKRGTDAEAGGTWSRRFAYAVGMEAVLAIAVLLVVGRLTSQAPARETLAQDAGRISIALDVQGRTATLAIAPGAVGPNHYRLDVAGAMLPDKTEALLRLDVPNVATGRKEIALTRAAGNGFEAHGSELSIAGTWGVEVILRKIGDFQWSTQTTLAIGAKPPAGSAPRPAWRFATGGVAGLVLLALGIAALALAWYAGRSPLRKESAGLGVVAIALGIVLLLQAHTTPASATIDLSTRNPIPADAASISRGQAAFLANCAQCHGTGGRGDGPTAAGLNPPPVDFLSGHGRAHLDAEYFNWIKNGKPPAAMPAFGGKLSDGDIWDIVNNIRSLQRAADQAAGSPVASPSPHAMAAGTPMP